MSLQYVLIVFEAIVFLFAISVHESAHAWMASRRGDPTARMLGRVTLNPIRHIDPVGTILLPIVCLVTHLPMFGWAKPTPVDPRNFKRPVLDDILTSVAGPVSNFLIATIALLLLLAIALTSRTGRLLVDALSGAGAIPDSSAAITPVVIFLYLAIELNVLLGVFNLIPIPPLDGSHVFRHLLPGGAQRIYDAIGWAGLILLFAFGGRFITFIFAPVLGVFNSILLAVR